MQLLNSREIQINTIPEPLRLSLHDIVNNINISNLSIAHPDYKPLELSEEAISRFQSLPSDLQHKYLNQQLCHFLYGIYYNNSLKSILLADAEPTDSALQQNLENNTFLGVDLAFYDRLHQSNTGQGYFSSNWLVVQAETENTLAVKKGGLTLYIERDRHLAPNHQTAIVDDLVAIKLPKNLVQNGFYMAVSNAGGYSGANTVRIYFNVTSEGAIALMNSLTSELNAINIPFNFKALYNPSDYGRCDSAVLYFDKSNYDAIHSVIEKVYAKHRADFQPEVPLFTKWLAPGLAIAEEPNHKFAEKESFGTNRCQMIANGLLEAWHKDEQSPEGKMSLIVQQFSALEIELQRPYLNAKSEDIYKPLKL